MWIPTDIISVNTSASLATTFRPCHFHFHFIHGPTL
jgi:hypothetical protein